MGAAVAVSLPLFTACDDDEATDPYDLNYVYIYSPAEADNNLEYKGNGTFITSIDEECVINPVRCTKPAPDDITVNLEIAPSLVESYNQEHGTSYTLLKGAKLENSSLTIKKGEYMSEQSLRVVYTDMSEFQNGTEKYILPIAISSIQGGNGLISENTSKVFLTFTSEYKANQVYFSGTSSTNNVKISDGEFLNAPDELSLGYIMVPSWAADDEIQVKVKIDNSRIDTYNALNSANAVAMPGVTLKSETLTIPAGEMGPSEYITLNLAEAFASLPKEANSYVIPVIIESVSGVGAEVGEKNVYYVLIKTTEVITILPADEPTGTVLTNVESWTVTVNGSSTSGGYEWKDLFLYPGDTSVSYWYKNRVMEIIMDTPATISSIAMYFYGASYSINDVRVEVSADGSVFKAGECTLTSNGEQYIQFSTPQNCKVIRITPLTVPYYPYPTGVEIYEAGK